MVNYDFVIYREGLTAKIVGDPVLGAQSEGVRVKIETDGSYPSDKYGTYLYYKFIDNSGIEHNNVAESTFDDTTRITTYYIPVQAFARPGEVMLSIELGNWSSGDANRIVTNPVYLVVKPSAKVYDPKSLPPDSSWQTMVTNYVSVKTSEIENEIRDLNENLAKSLQSRYGCVGSNSNGIDIVVKLTSEDSDRRFVWIDYDGIATFTLSYSNDYSSITNIVGSCKITLSHNSTSNALVIHYTAQYRMYLLISSGPLTISS